MGLFSTSKTERTNKRTGTYSVSVSQKGGGTMVNVWRLWAKALGEKAGSTDSEANIIAVIRTSIVLCYIITNLFIVSGVIRHW
jgi:hypothetical protein